MRRMSGTSDLTEHVAAAWRTAASDLGIRVTTPFVLERSVGGERLEFIALIHEFGSRAGTVVIGIGKESSSLQEATASAGYFFSALNLDCYDRYDRQLFIDTLNDWRYFGLAPPPSWYTGEAWTS